MSKSDLTINPTGFSLGLNPGRRLLMVILGLVAFAGVALAGPAVSKAADGLSHVNTNNTNLNGQTLNFGTNGQSNLPSSVTIYLWSNSASGGFLNLSNRTINADIRLNNSNYTRNGGSCDSGSTQGGYTFRASYTYRGGASFRSCSIILQLKSGTPVGVHNTTLDYASVGSGSANMHGTVTQEHGNVIRVSGPDGETGSLDYGDVAIGDSAERTFTLRNTGTSAVSNLNAQVNGASTSYSIVANDCPATLPLFSDCEVTVRFEPIGELGAEAQTLDFTSSSGHSTSMTLSGKGMVPVADLSIDSASHDFADVPVGFPLTHSFTIQNEGNTTLDLSFAFDGGSDPTFSRNGGDCGATLAVASSCTLDIEFAPTVVNPAVLNGAFTLTGTTPLVGSPESVSATVQGYGVAPTSGIEIRNTAGTAVLSEHTINNAPVAANTFYTFTVRNTGNVPIDSMTPSLSGVHASNYAVTSNTCNTPTPRGSDCQIQVRVTPAQASDRFATLTVTPAPSSTPAAPRSVDITTKVSGIRITNDQTTNLTGVNQKRWLDTLTLSPGGSVPSDTIRVAFTVDLATAADIAGVDIGTTTSTNDSAVGGYQNIGDLLSGNVSVEKKPGSSQAVVRAEVPLSSTALGTGNGQYGFSNGTTIGVCLGGGDYKTDDRRVWFRVRDNQGNTTSPVGSIVRFNNQNYTCPMNQGPQISGPRIQSVGGTNQPGGTSQATAAKGAPAVFAFNTRAKVELDILSQETTSFPVTGMNWRIRNANTGAMFRIVNGAYEACGAPCVDESNFTQGAKYVFDQNGQTSDQGAKTMEIPGIPSRGRWIVEGVPQTTSNEDDAHFFGLGVLRVNDTAANSPNVTFGGTLDGRPNTDTAYSIIANVTDPADPVNALDSEGGRGEVIEWDLDGNTTNGPLGDGFEIRYETDSATNLPAAFRTRTFDTTGKTPGPFTIRARVTDNGALMASESVAQQRIYEYTTTINSPAEATEETVEFESDHTQPGDVTFNATDADGDAYRVDITPNGANTGTLGGNHNAGIGQNTKPYTWPATFTGSDTFDFVATDDHLGQGAHQTLTVRVRPNTQIDSSTIAGLLHPDESNPATRFLGSTTSTDAEFTFSSLQNPVVEMECRLLNDGDVVEDWVSCASDDNGTVAYSDLEDGLNRVEVRAVNDEGDRDGTPAFRTWRVDNTAPETEVFVGPASDLPNQQPRFTNDDTPSYKFRATADERSLQQYMTYECRVMWGPAPGVWYPCGSPSDSDSSSLVHIVNGTPDFGISDPLPEGDYEIQVRATDEVGNLGPIMVEQFRVDSTVPETALASGPEGLINTRDVDYVLGSSQGQSTFLCELEGQNSGVVFSLDRCPGTAADGSRPAFTGLADDIYTLTAIAVDPATNQDPTPLEVAFEVDATEPETSMEANVDYGDGPTLLRRTQSRKVDITFSGTDSRQLQGFQCRIDSTDDGDWEICSSVQRFSGLADGDHKVEIRAKDEAGNVDSTPEVLDWVVDQDPPTTAFTVHPDPVTNDQDPAFEFEADEAISGSVCSLDGETAVACSSPLTLGDLGATLPLDDGVHHLTVRSTDIAGNVEQTVATVSWEQDTVDPTVGFTSKPAAYTPIGDASFAWEVKDGDPAELAPEVDAECALDPVDPDNIDGSEWVACDRDLTVAEADNTNGAHFLAVRAIDPAGNVSALETHQWTVLGAKPASPVIDDSSPADGASTRVSTANFAFHHELDGTGALTGLFCRIDDGTQTRCDDIGKSGTPGDAEGIGSFSVDALSDGPHTFSVVARDIAGNNSDPATVSWEVQRGAPVTSIDFGPSGASKQANATFQFSSDKAGTFECRIDGGNWEDCESPLELTELADGAHSFSVRSVSSVAPVGVKDPTPPVRNWNIDTVAPDVAINSAPEGQVVSYQGQVTFSSTDPDAGFQCKVGEGLFDACSSPWQLSGLSAGEQVVTVRAIDPAGNVSAEPATATWTVLDPVCDPDFDGTPPNCVAKAPVEGPAITAESTGGKLSLASLGEVELPEDQIKLVGKRGSDGRWFVPKEEVHFAPVEQVLEDVLGPGTSVTVTISISATGNGWGVLANGGGTARIKLPVRADVDAKLGAIALFPPGTCSLSPVTFNLVGTWDANANTAHVEQGDVAFPKLTGCGTFKATIDDLLELPRNDIEMAIDFKLTEEQVCEPPLVGTYPDCGPTPKITVTRPVVKGPKKIRFGKKATYRVRVTNTGNTEAKGVKLCLNVPKKFFKGKARRCATVKVPAGKARARAFVLNRKPVKVNNRKVVLRATATYKDAGGVSRTKRGNATPQLLKHPVKGKNGAGK